MTRKRLAIIGNGMATSRLLDELFRRCAAYDVAVFGEEPHGAYNRILLGRILTGASADDITLKPPSWYAERGVVYYAGTRVERLAAVARQLHTADGRAFPYDVAVFATGSAPIVPRLDNLHAACGDALKENVFVFRTIEDCQRMRAVARPAASAVVIGGGLLGLEAAKALSDLGLHVTVLHMFDTLMNLQVDHTGGQLLRAAVERLGIYVRTSAAATALLGNGHVEAVKLEGGPTLPADLVVFACGIRPRIDVAKASGIPTNNGILVNDLLATQTPGVFALGECAEHNGTVYGIVPPIWEQCQVLADVLTGANPQARYRGSKLYTRLKVAGVEVASMGLVEPVYDTDEVIQIIEDRKGIYRKLIVRDGRLVGALLIGSTDAAAALVQWFDRGDPLPGNRLDVLCSADAAPAIADPEVCDCHHVCESTLVTAIESGCTTLPQLAAATQAGTGCGSCRGQLTNLILKNARVPA
jgi:nitrite reductase [NAD(P)H] large subunit